MSLTPQRWRRRTVTLLALLTPLAACARRVAPAAADGPARLDSAGVDQGEVPIVVENHNSDDVVVAVRSASSQPRRLGTVVGNGQGAFTLTGRFAAASQRLVLIAHPVGARGSYQSEAFTVQRGQTVSWTLASGFTGSTVSVY